MVTYQLQVERRTAKAHRPKTDALPLDHVTKCGQTAEWIKMALGMEVGLGPGHIVLDGELAPLRKKGAEPPIFGPFLLSPNGRMNQDGTWQGGVAWSKPHCARWGPSHPQFSAHFYCRQTAGCIKMPLGMEVDLSPGDCVLDGDPASPSLHSIFIIC